MKHRVRGIFGRNDAVLRAGNEFVDHGLGHALLDAIAGRVVLERGHGDDFQAGWKLGGRSTDVVAAGGEEEGQRETEAKREDFKFQV